MIDGKVTLKLLVDEDRLVLYSTVVALDKLGVNPDVLVNHLLKLVPTSGKEKDEFTAMALSVIESIQKQE